MSDQTMTFPGSSVGVQDALILLLASDVVSGDDEQYPLDRVRLQKAGFLLSMRGPARWHGAFTYRPYDWGPYSDELTAHVRQLSNQRLIRLSPTHGRYDAHLTTGAGEALAEALWKTMNDLERGFVQSVRFYVTNRSFQQLLTEIYAAYPEYAVNSKFAQ